MLKTRQSQHEVVYRKCPVVFARNLDSRESSAPGVVACGRSILTPGQRPAHSPGCLSKHGSAPKTLAHKSQVACLQVSKARTSTCCPIHSAFSTIPKNNLDYHFNIFCIVSIYYSLSMVLLIECFLVNALF